MEDFQPFLQGRQLLWLPVWFLAHPLTSEAVPKSTITHKIHVSSNTKNISYILPLFGLMFIIQLSTAKSVKGRLFYFSEKMMLDLSCVLFVLRFYGPVNPMGSCWAQWVYLTTCLLGRLSPLSGWPILCTFFCQKLTTALLESVEGREWP